MSQNQPQPQPQTQKYHLTLTAEAETFESLQQCVQDFADAMRDSGDGLEVHNVEGTIRGKAVKLKARIIQGRLLSEDEAEELLSVR